MNENIYEKKSIHSLILYFSIPAIFSLLVEIMASMVDTAFAGHLGDRAVDALITMGLLSPVLSIYTTFQALFAVSTAIMVAKHLKNQEVRKKYFITGVYMTFIAAAGVSICSYSIMPEILSFVGATGTVAKYAEEYLKIQLCSNICSALGYTCTSCIRAFGYPRIEMCITGASVFANIVFNMIFVFGFNAGIKGLANGTFLSELFCCVFSALWLYKYRLIPGRWHISMGQLKKCTVKLLKQWGSKIFYIVFSTFPLMGIFYTITTLYEVTGHEGKAVFLILTRQVFLMIPLTNLLPKIFPALSCAVFCAVPIADLTVVLIALFSGGRKRKTHEEVME